MFLDEVADMCSITAGNSDMAFGSSKWSSEAARKWAKKNGYQIACVRRSVVLW
jgi:hypothetical protein